MKLYRIRDWDNIYENNRSRLVKDLSWVPIPNRHDGENFSLIMIHEDGATIYAGWILLLQIASKCTPRGTLIRDNGTPHNVRTLSAKCRCPASWFETAIPYLETETDWLEVVHTVDEPTERQLADSRLTPSCQSGDEEGKGREGNGKKGMEWKGRNRNGAGPGGQPTADELIARFSADSTYAGIDVRREYGKMAAWCGINKKEPTSKRFINWLNRVDKPLSFNQRQNGPNI